MKYFLRIAGLVLCLFTSLFLQFCTHPCGKQEFRKQEVVNYFYGYAYKLDNQQQKKAFSNDSILMQAGDTIHFTMNAETRTVQREIFADGGLYACSPEEQMLEPLGDSVRVYALENFDATHPAGSDVSEFFMLPEHTYSNGIPVTRYFNLKEYRDKAPLYGHGLSFSLVKKPVSKNMRFKFYFYFSKLTDGASCESRALVFY